MDSLSSVSPSIVLPPSNPLRHYHRRLRISVSAHHPMHHRLSSLSSFLCIPCSPEPCGRRFFEISCKSTGRGAGGDENVTMTTGEMRWRGRFTWTGPFRGCPMSSSSESRRALTTCGDTSNKDSSSYDVLETNPWRETSKPVYVLTHRENQLCTMKTRRNRSEVERELGMLFSKGRKWRSEFENQPKQTRTGTKFQMLVEDVREGVLVFEDENEAARYCDLLQGGGQGCEGITEIEAFSVFDLCQKMRALAVLFHRGRTPPQPESLKLNMRARKRSLEDQED